MIHKTCSDPDVLWKYRTNVRHNCWCFQYPAIEAAYVLVNIHMKFLFKTWVWLLKIIYVWRNGKFLAANVCCNDICSNTDWILKGESDVQIQHIKRLRHLSCKPAILRGSVLHDPNINASVQEFSSNWLNEICQSPPPEHIHFSNITSDSN